MLVGINEKIIFKNVATKPYEFGIKDDNFIYLKLNSGINRMRNILDVWYTQKCEIYDNYVDNTNILVMLGKGKTKKKYLSDKPSSKSVNILIKECDKYYIITSDVFSENINTQIIRDELTKESWYADKNYMVFVIKNGFDLEDMNDDLTFGLEISEISCKYKPKRLKKHKSNIIVIEKDGDVK